MKRAFVDTLKTPALLAIFSKDPMSAALAQGAIKSMSILEPSIIMPAILERAYSGLESINEVRLGEIAIMHSAITHRRRRRTGRRPC